ncbi:TPA: hypothetical protein ACXDAY_002936 [Clostridium botulinum]|uniref:hypothetical protein n=1 Tax=Clostridium botulinum TaxID=1491 RepID=UPI00035BA424|nr:hypothetical protein [Clostridium botulinum]APH21986.1 hypothetical protein NPD1_3298 [Clostridium botulinum]APQ67605.1 hypothetical protein RSJ8_1424 [Clostridium botulinum]EPS56306.1 hypothetical protein CLQ_12443 [Clostridium botulinum Af84]MBN3351851.1 hypothetical protein [Clostridium botulinum]MBN3359448.1 hypothetical protein [Clostridium botulinum]
MEEIWEVTFVLPKDYGIDDGEKIKIKDGCQVNLKIKYSELLLILQDNIHFFHNEIMEKDTETFIDKDFETSLYSRYKVDYKEIDLDDKTARIELKYEIY